MRYNSQRMFSKSTFASLFLFLILCSCKPPAIVEKKAESGPVEITVSTAQTRDIQRSIDSVGSLFPMDEAVISAEIDGKLEEVKVDLGDAVEPGQILARISEEEQKYLVAQNNAQLRQSLEKLGLKNERDKVQDINQTPEVRKAKAELNEADMRYQRTKKLVEQGIGAKSDLDQTSSRLQSAQAALDAILNQTRNLIQEVERFQAMLDFQRKKLRDTVIKAPFRALVKDRQAVIGQFVRVNTPLFTLVKVDPVRLRIDVPERMAPWVRMNQEITVSLEAFEGKKFKGKIWRISPTVEQNKRTFMVEALISNPGAALKPGSYARAHVPTEKKEQVIIIPAKSVNYVLGSNKAYIYKNGIIEAREVKLGERLDQDIEILEGVLSGEQVAMSQLNRLDTGTKVRIKTN